MGQRSDSTPPRRRIGGEAKAAFVAGLRAGLSRDAAAAQAGFTANGFYYARARDTLFALAWTWANDLSAADACAARRAAAPPDPETTAIAPNAKRRLQLRPVRRARFDDRRKRIFLEHFAGTADVRASADAAGVSVSTVTAHRRDDPDFDAACEAALAIAYAALEAEAVRQRLEAQRKLADGLLPAGEMTQEFDRMLKLLTRYERRNGRIGSRRVDPGREARWSFDDAVRLLDRKLRALGLRHGIVPPDDPPRLPPPGEAEAEDEG
jgi:hypothetical protein